MIDVNELRKGVTFQVEGDLYRVLEYTHNKPGRGTATIRIKARDLRKFNTLEMTFISGDRVKDIRLDYHNVQYLYRDENFYYFMDMDTFEQPAIPTKLVEEYEGLLKENMEVKLTFFGEEPLDIELPTSVDLKVVSAEASARGNTATGVTKQVITDTGLKVQVPGFVNEGDTIRVDTRTGEYLTRV
ncbi:MAG: elongation factor P [Anaerolineaceae bacterium]|jgi:elongation factor P|nr:elongation factor P [Anaerolineaceae bacterium]HNX45232.1 elongation factor P [Anaerolineaceae bacterium]HPT23333.1 elongation factor P [Anaerolineaceae bacterium]